MSHSGPAHSNAAVLLMDGDDSRDEMWLANMQFPYRLWIVFGGLGLVAGAALKCRLAFMDHPHGGFACL